MLGLNLLMRLGRGLLAGPITDSGLLPAAVYRHLALAALEEEDFPGVLNNLQWAGDPLLTQVLILRLRLLADKHREQRRRLEDLLSRELPPERREKCQAASVEADRALALLAQYEQKALAMLNKTGRLAKAGMGPSASA